LLDDNLWYLKSWDENDVAIVKIHCGECVKDFGGIAGDYNSHAINNLFTNFRKTHLHTTLHIRNLCRRQGLPYTDHPQSATPRGKAVILSASDHKNAVEQGMEVVKDVNNIVDAICGKKPFSAVDDSVSEGFRMRSYWIKVR
jgi:hypothetical protein